MLCKNHPEVPATARCAGCAESFCDNCLVEIKGERYCGSCKVLAIQGAPLVVEGKMRPCKEAGEALTFALVGLVCFGIVLEPIAIVKALSAKKKIAADPQLTGNGKATAALAIASVVLLLWVVGLIVTILEQA